MKINRPLLVFIAVLLAVPAGAQRTARRDTLPARGDAWPVKTREHVDLWLHAFALLTEDSSQVPLFRRNYRDPVIVEKNRRGIVTDFDANADALRAELQKSRSLPGAQFAALAFQSEAEMDRAFDAFIAAGGDPRRVSNKQSAQMVAYLAQYFQTPDEQEWARRLMNSLKSERTRFHHEFWVDEQRRRTGALAATDSLWQRVFRPSIDRFLSGTRQASGEVLLALPLEGEGRTMSFGARQNIIAVGFPDSAAAAPEAMYALAHELVGAVVGPTIADNLSPAQIRAGEGERLSAIGLVRGGLMLMQKAQPQWATGYAKFYLRVARVSYAGDPVAALERAFPLNADLAGTIRRQIDAAFGGI
ncbi:MAG: hypothetical protein ACYC3L_04920 [Gemmatimonadaceae bacterium]